MIAALEDSNPSLFSEYRVESRRGQAEASLIKSSGRYPLTAIGKINTYSVFAEHFRGVLAPSGRSGIITPTGLATDATTAPFFADTLSSARLASFYDFENEAKIFADVHHAFRFALSSMTGGERVADVQLAFVQRHVASVSTSRFRLEASEVLLLNPNTGTLPLFRSRTDADITLGCYRRHPVLIKDGGANPWNVAFKQGLFNMASDSGSFITADDCADEDGTYDGWAWETADRSLLPLYEGKMLSHWNNRFSTYEGATQAELNVGTLPRLLPDQLDDPYADVRARYWVDEAMVREAVPEWWDRDWLFGWRDITGQEKWRTFVASALPLSAVGHVFPLAFPLEPTHAPLLQAVWSSMVFDYVGRQKLSGTHMTYGVVKQQPTPTPGAFDEARPWGGTLAQFVRPRVLELTYTSHRMAGYARDVLAVPAGSPVGGPFRWLPERRAQLMAEIDAAMFHVYDLSRAEAEHVLDSFPVVRRNEERDLGEYRTKRLVLAAYDALADAAAGGVSFVSPLDPPPGDGPRHPERPAPARTERST